MTIVRSVAATAIVVLMAGMATWLTAAAGYHTILSLAWVIGIPVAVARISDPRRHAWAATSLWLVMCSVAAIVATGTLLAVA